MVKTTNSGVPKKKDKNKPDGTKLKKALLALCYMLADTCKVTVIQTTLPWGFMEKQ